MRTRNSILAAVAVIGLGAALLIFRNPHVSAPSAIPSRAPEQGSKAEAVAKPLRVDHLDNERAKRTHPLDALQARGAGQILTSERWAPFGEVSEEAETASLQHASVTPAAEKLPGGAIENIVADLENELQEKGGLYGYNSRHYGANMEAGWVEFATNHQFRIGAPTLSYALEAIKVGDHVIARGGAAEPQAKADARVVVYARGSVDEEYALRPEAMEQTFVVKELPELRGAITVTGVVGSNLTGPAEGTKGEKLAFSYKGNEIITISSAVAIDAAGSKKPLELAWSDGRVTMTVPADWVASAQLPIRIDPLVGSPFSVFTTTDPNTNYTVGNAWPVRMVDAAYSPTNATWFVVWTQRWGTGGSNGFDYDVRAQRVTATGTLVGGIVGIDTSTAGAYEPCISYSAGSSFDRYLIAWRHDPSNNLSDNDQRIQGKIHGGDGVFITLSSFPIEDPAGQDIAPTAAFDGTNWYVSYTNKVSSSNYDVRGRFVSTAGTPGTSASPDTATGDSAYMSSVSYANGVYMIAWNKGTTSSGTISARTMLPSGTFPTAITTVEPNTNAPREVDISGGGTQFLMVWRNNSNQSISGRIANASTGATITFPASTFTIQTSSASARSTPRAAYSTTSSAWYTLWADAATNGTDIYGAKVSSAGVVSPVDQISSDPTWEWRPEIAWNSATNEMLLVYNYGSGGPSFALKGQRFSMATTAPPPAPTNLVATPGNGQVTLTWTASTGATSYNVKRGNAPGGPYATVVSGITTTSYTNTGLVNGTTYYYVVTAQNAGGESGNSNQAIVTPVGPPAAPTGLAAAAGNAQTVLTWTASAGATTYNVKRGTAPGGPYPTVFSGITTTSYTNTGLTNNSTYYYVVTAQNVGGESGNSNEAFVTPVAAPAAPTGLGATPGNTQIALSWTASAGATTYNVKQGTGPGGPYPTVFTGITATTFTSTGLTNGTPYYFVVTAQNAGGQSGNSNEATAVPVVPPPPPPPAPTGLGAAPGNAQATLTWTASSNATSYNVKRGTAPGGPYPTVFTGIATTSFTNTGLTNGTTYYYVVTAQNAGGESGISNQAIVAPVGLPLAPTGLAAAAGNAQAVLTWTASAGATTYNLKRGTAPGGPYPTIFSGITTTSFTNTGLTNNSAYYYVVTAQNVGGESSASNEALVTPLAAPAPPAGLGATAGNAQIVLTWTASAGATTYNVKQGTAPGGPYPNVFSGITATTFTSAGLTNGTPYYFVVTAQNAGGESGTSNQASATPVPPTPPAPTGLAASPGNGQVTLTWTASSGATTYNVKRGTAPGGPYPTIFSGVATTSFTDTGLTNGSTYYYVATAQNAGGESGNSNQAIVTPVGIPAAPTGLAAAGGNAQAVLTWTASAGATTYTVKRGTAAGGPYPTTFSGIGGTTYTDSGLTNGTPYYYVLTASNASGESTNSNEAVATPGNPPVAPTGVLAMVREAEVDLTWTASAGGGIAGYNIYRSTNSGGPFILKINLVLVTDSHAEDFELLNGTYFYVVRAVNASNQESGNSNVATATVTAIAPPTGLTATGLNSRVSLSWTSVPGAFSYNVLRSTVSGGPYVLAGNIGSVSFVNTGLTDGVSYFFVVTTITSAGESRMSQEVSAVPNPPSSFGVLLVVGNASLIPADVAIQQRLSDLGYNPTIEVNSTGTTGAAGKSLIVLSASCNAAVVGATFAGTSVSVLNLHPALMNPLGMTGSVLDTDFGTSAAETQVAMVAANSAHPLAAGFTGLVSVLVAPGYPVTFGKGGANAISIATLTGDTTKSAIFGYEAGTLMPGFTAPARRTGSFSGLTSAEHFTPEGMLLFDASVAWSLGAPEAPVAVELVPGGTYISLNWAPSAGALSYRVLRALSLNGPYTSIGGEISGTNFVDFGVQDNITYFYKVVALNDLGPGVAALVQQGRRTQISYRIMIQGPRTLQVLRPDGTMFQDHYRTGTYSPQVAQVTSTFNADGSLRSETSIDYTNQISGVVTWEPDPNAPAGMNQLNILAESWPWTAQTLTVTSTSNAGTAYLRCGVRNSGDPNILAYGSFSITSGTRFNMVQISFKFPDCTPTAARTQQDPPPPPPPPYPDQTIYTNANLWSTDVSLQSNSRSSFYPPYVDHANELWKQAAIRFYGGIAVPDDHVLPPANDTSTWFHASNNGFIIDRPRNNSSGTRVGWRPSAQFNALADQNNHDNTGYIPGISVYFFFAIYSSETAARGGTVNGATYPAADPNDHRRNTIVLADTGNASSLTLAHELGHLLGLEHVGEPRAGDDPNLVLDPVGPGVNNLVPLFPNPPPAGYVNMLMYRVGATGSWLPGNQVDAARAELLRRSAGGNLQANQEP